ncbi:AAA domain (plasmid) [Vibrio sp. B1REV9]|nr:AAA domain [Vibrio sp. B1REV9]
MSAIIDSLESVCERMQQEQADLKAVIKERMQINVTDKQVEGSVDRLIYNHSLKKKRASRIIWFITCYI